VGSISPFCAEPALKFTPRYIYLILGGIFFPDVIFQDMKLQKLINHPSRLHDLRFLRLSDGRECLLIAAEDRKVSVYSYENGDLEDTSQPPYAAFIGHSNR
jgi:protein MAK11